MTEFGPSAPDNNLQLLLDRYSLAGAEFDPSTLDIAVADATSMAQAQPRKGYLYGELTRYGLVHVWADVEKSQHARAHVLVIDGCFAWAGSHTYNRRSEQQDWRDYTDIYDKLSLVAHTNTLTTVPRNLTVAESTSDMTYRHIRAQHDRVVHTLAAFARINSRYDALHQTFAHRYPQVPELAKPLFPYAGDAFGPRVNVEDMLQAGVPFHPAVAAALRTAPKLDIIE